MPRILHKMRHYNTLKIVNLCPRKSNEPMSSLLFSTHISNCVKEVSETLVKFPTHFKLSNLLGFNDFRHLSARSRNKLARQEVNDSNIRSIGQSELKKSNQWWKRLFTTTKTRS